MKSVLISTRPKWCEKIASGKKTIEVRKTAPKEVPFKAYIYETKKEHLRVVFKKGDYIFSDDHNAGKFDENIFVKDRYSWQGKVVGEFICDKVYNLVNAFGGIMFADENLNQLEPQLFRDMSCLTDEQTADYLGDKDGYGWHISDLKIYDKPKELSEFRPICKFEGKDAICALFCPNWKYDGGLFFECTRKVTRPPQSWCYVEELCKAQN